MGGGFLDGTIDGRILVQRSQVGGLSLKADAELEVVVLGIDKENRRLSLGHKQIEENPWDVFEEKFTVGSIHQGTIIEMQDRGAVVELEDGVQGFATPKHLIKEDGSQAKLNDKIDFKVIEFNKESKRIILSHCRIHEDAEREANGEEPLTQPKKATAKKAKKENVTSTPLEKTTLGDIDALQNLKDQLENNGK